MEINKIGTFLTDVLTLAEKYDYEGEISFDMHFGLSAVRFSVAKEKKTNDR